MRLGCGQLIALTRLGRSMRKKTVRVIMINMIAFLMIVLNSTTIFAASLASPRISGQVTFNSATVSFSSSAKVSGYEVSSALNKGPAKVVYSGTKTSYTFTGLSAATVLTITVRSYVTVKSKTTYSTAVSITLQPSLAAVVLKGSTAKGNNTLSWSKVAGASSYEISYSTSYTGSYKVLTSVNTLTTNHKVGLKKGYYYKVRAYNTVNNKKNFGPFSNITFLQS